ncbi:unnamed protein product [Ectocarpus sp. 8 AP-2014]
MPTTSRCAAENTSTYVPALKERGKCLRYIVQVTGSLCAPTGYLWMEPTKFDPHIVVQGRTKKPNDSKKKKHKHPKRHETFAFPPCSVWYEHFCILHRIIEKSRRNPHVIIVKSS